MSFGPVLPFFYSFTPFCPPPSSKCPHLLSGSCLRFFFLAEGCSCLTPSGGQFFKRNLNQVTMGCIYGAL